MSEHEGPIVEAVEESESVIDAAPEVSLNEDVVAPEAVDTDSAAAEVSESVEASVASTSAPETEADTSATVENDTSKSDDSTETTAELAESEAPSEASDNIAADASGEAGTPSEEENAEAPAAAASEAAPSPSEAEQKGKKVVRTIAVGQELTGTVKRLADFGAFIDIGVGRDGLLHVSELSVQRVNKVSDVLTKGQEVNVWIKELNREKNRISLTLISPDTKTIRDINKDDILEGTVTRMTNFGAFVDIGIGRDALLHVREMAEGFVKRPEDVVSIGETMEVRIVELNRRRGRVDLSIKGLRPEPEAAEAPENAGFADGEEEFVDEFENVEPMSAIELALKRAMEADGSDESRSKRARRKQKRNQSDGMDDIISRTLSGSEV